MWRNAELSLYPKTSGGYRIFIKKKKKLNKKHLKRALLTQPY